MSILAFTAAMAAPPSSTLTGPDGTLSWKIEQRDGLVHIEGRSPKWVVHHQARPDLTPVRTERLADSATVVVEYTPEHAVVTMPNGKQIIHDRAGIWDGDTLDVRLGHRFAAGKPAVVFHAIDTGSGKLYKFDSQLIGQEDCNGTSCGHVRVQLTGVYRLVGPTFDYWFGKDGKLLRFEGPAGSFTAK